MKTKQINRLMIFKIQFHLNDNKIKKNQEQFKLSFSVPLNIDHMHFKYEAFNFPLKDKYYIIVTLYISFLNSSHQHMK